VSQELENFLSQHLPAHLCSQPVKIEKLFGQASSRQYFRATVATTNYVIMKLPQGFSSPAEEITKTDAKAPKEFPFINVQKYLSHLDIPVPQIFSFEAAQGLILLEDLGDKTLENLVQNADGEFFLFYYKKVIDILIDLQTKTLKNPSKDCVAYFREFDAQLLNWEFEHFLEYGIEDRKKIKLDDTSGELFKKITQKLTDQITHMPQGFVHRDFQSRNILFKNYNFFLIDFQDALKGPLLYDFVALLRDSYIHFTPDQTEKLILHYTENVPDSHPYYQQSEKVKNDFHLISIHRKLKDAGRFQYILTERKNPGFLVHVPQSLAYVKNSLLYLKKNPDCQDLLNFLCHQLEEFR
jgi:aminoglycoside/choline kinase family phosphotransferase